MIENLAQRGGEPDEAHYPRLAIGAEALLAEQEAESLVTAEARGLPGGIIGPQDAVVIVAQRDTPGVRATRDWAAFYRLPRPLRTPR